MSTLATTGEKFAQIETLTVDQHGAERLTGLSYRTIERAAARGENVGILRVGKRKLFIKSILSQWLASKATTPAEIGA